MADFSAFKITNNGIQLEILVQAGETLNFTKFELGDGAFSGDVKTLTALVNPIMEVPVSRLRTQIGENTKVIIGFDLSSHDVTSGFYLREIGIYAEDPEGGDDILVFYGNSGDSADYIEPSSSATMTEKMIDIEMYIDNATSITAVIDSSLVYATQDDMDTVITALAGKAQTNHASSANTYGLGSSTLFGHTKIIDNLTSSTQNAGESLSAYQGYLLNQKFNNYLALSGGTLTGNVAAGNNKFSFSDTGNAEWKQVGYGNKFRIIPNFSGTDDSNLLNIQATVGGAGTDPTNWKTLFQVTAKSGNILTPGYVSATDGFRGNLTGNAATATKWATARTVSLSGAVAGSATIDGSSNIAITTSIPTGSSVPTSSTAGDIYIQYF